MTSLRRFAAIVLLVIKLARSDLTTSVSLNGSSRENGHLRGIDGKNDLGRELSYNKVVEPLSEEESSQELDIEDEGRRLASFKCALEMRWTTSSFWQEGKYLHTYYLLFSLSQF